jgi:hypothetical protein
VRIPVGKKGSAIWLLLAGTTNPMQTGIANGIVRLDYQGGLVDELPLVHPTNFWKMDTEVPGRENERFRDYDYRHDAFALPRQRPWTLELGKNCRAMVIARKLDPDRMLESLTLETLSPEVIIGLIGVTIS